MTRKTLAENGCGAVVMAAYALVAGGCAPAKPPQAKPVATTAAHDHAHDHGEHTSHDTLAGALAELEKICANVKQELGAKNLDKADGHVHMVGHLVDDMHRLVGSATLNDDAKVAATKALDEIFEAFDKLDTALHSSDAKVKEAVDYLEHEPRIQAAIGELKKAAEAGKDSVEGADAKE